MKPTHPKIPMLDLWEIHEELLPEILSEIEQVIRGSKFIKGNEVLQFEKELSAYLGCEHLISCGNGTDALQIAYMGLGLQPGDEVIMPAFTYMATVEAAMLLGLVPILVDVDRVSFNMDLKHLANAVSKKTRAIVVVHLFGLCANMSEILDFASENDLKVVEDSAQALGSTYQSSQGERKAGTMGAIGCFSFFPSKNLGAMGDGGALCTNDPQLAERLRMIAQHGQKQKYIHEVVGVNSRLDGIQACVLRVKLRHFENHLKERIQVAENYKKELSDLPYLETPQTTVKGRHTFHQFTIKVGHSLRDKVQRTLAEHQISSTIYYPIPIHRQPAFELMHGKVSLPHAEQLCQEVLSLPMGPNWTRRLF